MLSKPKLARILQQSNLAELVSKRIAANQLSKAVQLVFASKFINRITLIEQEVSTNDVSNEAIRMCGLDTNRFNHVLSISAITYSNLNKFIGRSSVAQKVRSDAWSAIIGQDILLCYELIRACRDHHLFIYGETGTGKELIGQAALHGTPLKVDLLVDSASDNTSRFRSININEFSPSLIESELFGHEKGSFTGASTVKKGQIELADGGALFIDEIAEMPLHLQSKILRVMQEKETRRVGAEKAKASDVRYIFASNRNLLKEMEDGNFRKDLGQRVQGITVKIPPLRERREDIPDIVQGFIDDYVDNDNYSVAANLQNLAYSIGKSDAILNHDWPGNVRELKNAVLTFIRTGSFQINSLIQESTSELKEVFDNIMNATMSEEEICCWYCTHVLKIHKTKRASLNVLKMAKDTLDRRLRGQK